MATLKSNMKWYKNELQILYDIEIGQSDSSLGKRSHNDSSSFSSNKKR